MIVGVVQARVSSRRLPGKVLAPIAGEAMIVRQLERLAHCQQLDRLVVATSDESSDDPLAELCAQKGFACFRGPLDDVLDRVRAAALAAAARELPTHVVRFTGDCPLSDPARADRVIEHHRGGGYDYTCNTAAPGDPDGLDVEAMRFGCLDEAWREARLPSEREHVTLYLRTRPERYRLGAVHSQRDESARRLSVDEAADLEVVRAVFAALHPRNPLFGRDEILAFLDAHPEVAAGNARIERDAALPPETRRALAAAAVACE